VRTSSNENARRDVRGEEIGSGQLGMGLARVDERIGRVGFGWEIEATGVAEGPRERSPALQGT
jgi:hypothetical protein